MKRRRMIRTNKMVRKRGRRRTPYGDWEEEESMKERTRGSVLTDCQGMPCPTLCCHMGTELTEVNPKTFNLYRDLTQYR